MTDEPFLHVDEPPGPVRGLALVLHGGRANSRAATRAGQLAVLRMAPFVWSLRRAGAAHGLAVARMRYQVRGWNGAAASPVPDVETVLDRLTTRYPDVPIALAGHSMGGRAALYAAGHRAVEVVVGLAPWVEPGDPSAQLRGRRLLVAHGDEDRMTSPIESRRYTAAAADVAASATYVTIDGEKHSMLHRPRVWHELTTGFVLGALLDIAPAGTVGAEAANVVRKALNGEHLISA